MRSGYNLIMEVTDVSKTVLQSNQVSYSKDGAERGQVGPVVVVWYWGDGVGDLEHLDSPELS